MKLPDLFEIFKTLYFNENTLIAASPEKDIKKVINWPP